jgi:hypothetical protein
MVQVTSAIDLQEGKDYFARHLGEPRQGAERPAGAVTGARGDPSNLIQLMLA